jgi:putative membrane protein
MQGPSLSILTAAVVVTLAASAAAQAPTPRPDPQTPPAASPASSVTADAEFAHKAAMGGKKEVESAKFAAGKAASADVKAFANRLVKDHTAANQELMNLMKTKHMTAMNNTDKPDAEAWRSQRGAAFDRAFLDHAIEHHEKDIALFETESKDGADAELKAWATAKLPTLRAHLKQAQELKSKVQTTTQQ